LGASGRCLRRIRARAGQSLSRIDVLGWKFKSFFSRRKEEEKILEKKYGNHKVISRRRRRRRRRRRAAPERFEPCRAPTQFS
jgi:hypothetical protein